MTHGYPMDIPWFQDGFDLNLLESGDLEATFALDSSEVAFGVAGAAFLLSVVDNVIVSGPHEPKAVLEKGKEKTAVVAKSGRCN